MLVTDRAPSWWVTTLSTVEDTWADKELIREPFASVSPFSIVCEMWMIEDCEDRLRRTRRCSCRGEEAATAVRGRGRLRSIKLLRRDLERFCCRGQSRVHERSPATIPLA